MDYVLIRSKRNTMSISVDDGLRVVVRAPMNTPVSQIDKFVADNIQAIENMIASKKKLLEKYNVSDEELMRIVKSAKEILPKRVEYYSSLMDLKPTSVKITKAKKRFGSCSGKNGICFSCYLMLYPMEAVDYVVVHELAHIKHHNHSREFYALIKRYMPDYKKREKLLKQL